MNGGSVKIFKNICCISILNVKASNVKSL